MRAPMPGLEIKVHFCTFVLWDGPRVTRIEVGCRASLRCIDDATIDRGKVTCTDCTRWLEQRQGRQRTVA